MALTFLLAQKKDSILSRWIELVLDTYPPDSSRFLKKEKDRFINPVGHTISHEMAAIYEGLIQGTDCDRITASLENMIRIRAVQDFPPSQAVSFFPLLKKVVREELAGEISGSSAVTELLEFESRVDEATLFAFDLYMKYREKVCQIRMNEVKARSDSIIRLLERTNMVYNETGDSA